MPKKEHQKENSRFFANLVKNGFGLLTLNKTKMTKEKHSKIKFDQHKLHVVENDHFSSFHLKIDGTIRNNVKFTLIDGVTLITGDFGNWVACRPFNPRDGDIDSVGYFCEKLTISSTQETKEWDSDYLESEVKDLIDGLKERGVKGKSFEKSKEFLEDSLGFGDDEIDYVSYCRDNMPECFDYEYLPDGYVTKYRIFVLVDAFNEIYQRLKKEEIIIEEQITVQNQKL